MKTKILFTVAVLVVAGGAFYGGMVYAQSPKALSKLSPAKIQAAFAAGRGANGASGGNGTFMFRTGGRGSAGGANGGGFTGGQIISKDDKSITIKLPNNAGTKTVYISDSTQVQKSVDGSLTDLATNDNVTIQGSSNSDGSITAQSIQIRPDMQQMPVQSSNNQ